MRPQSIGRNRSVVVCLLAVVMALASASVAEADVVRLRRLQTDDTGMFTVLFSVLDSNRDPVPDPTSVPISSIHLLAGTNPAELSEIQMVEAQPLITMRDYPAPFRVFILLPNQDLFNGEEGNANRPDAQGMRAALAQAVQTLPQRADIRLFVGVYNQDVRWLPEFNTTQFQELSSALTRSEYVAPPGTRVEDPFNAIDVAYRTKLRRQARVEAGQDFIYYFIIVTSALTQVADSETFTERATRLRGLLGEDDMSDVTTMVIVYNPLYDDTLLNDPGGEPIRFAQGVTPEGGTYRIVGNVEGIRAAFQQSVDEIRSAFVLRFNNTQLEGDVNYHFKIQVTPQGGEQIESNVILAHVAKVKVDYLRWIIIGGSALVGLILLIILIVWLAKRPKKEKSEEKVVVPVEQVQLCVQCGRALRSDLQYCHHCAAEPNHGLIKVLEGPKSGWTYFLRETVNSIGKSVGNQIIIDGDPGISGNHLRITVLDGRRYMIEDTKSTNGTFIEGQKVDKQYLKNGDVIALGTATKVKFTIT
jgi:hypothetical protein